MAEAVWGVVLHCALQLPPLSTASYLQLELEVSVLGKCLAAFDSEFTCAACAVHLHPRLTRFASPPPFPLQIGHQGASAGGHARAVLRPRIQRTGARHRQVLRSRQLCSSACEFACLNALWQLSSKKSIIRDFLYRSKSMMECIAAQGNK